MKVRPVAAEVFHMDG